MRSRLLFQIAFFVTLSVWLGKLSNAHAGTTSQSAIERKLEKTIIPKVEFQDATLEEALDFLRSKAVELDPKHKGVPVILKPEAICVVSSTNGGSSATEVSPRELRITLSLTKIPLRETLKYVADLSNLKIRIHPESVELVPLSDPDPMLTKELRFDPKWLEEPEYTDGLRALREAFKRLPPEQALEQDGVVFPKGAWASFNKIKSRLIVHNAAENIENIESTLRCLKTLHLPPVGPPRLLSGPTRVENTSLRKKLRRIVLPAVSFNNIPLREAVNDLKALSQKYDAKKSDPSHRGVNIVISSGSYDSTPSSQPTPSLEQLNTKPITFVGSRTTLLETLEAVAKLAEMKLRIGPYAVALVPLSEPEPLIIKEYFVHPALFYFLVKKPASMDEVSEAEKKHASQFLESSGIRFPAGPAANYLQSSCKLVVRNTEEKHAEIEKKLAEAWEDYNATHKKTPHTPKP